MEIEKNELLAENVESEQNEETAVAVAEENTSRRKIRALFCVIALFVVVVGMAAVWLYPYAKYGYACHLLEQKNYESAQRQFQELGDFKDSAGLCVEAQNMQLYEQAKALMDSGEYTAARHAFQDLGDFLDAKEQRQKARHMEGVEKKYKIAESDYQMEMYLMAYDEICKIQDEPYAGISELKEQILSGIYDQMMDSWKNGNVLLARHELKMLEEIKYPEVEGLREKLVQEMRMELDTGYYDAINSNHITGFNASTTAEEYGSVIKYMYLNHVPSVTLYANGKRPLHSTASKRILEGSDLVDDILPELGTIYGVRWIGYYTDAVNYDDEITITLTHGESASLEETVQQAEGIKTYCEETVRMLNDELLLTNTMSNRAKAHMIMEWVVNYLDYDHSLETHNAFAAIQSQYGVCESYTAIYNYMCNLAGVPSFGMIGPTVEDGKISDDTVHIWSMQLDEEGNVFYTDATWADGSFSGQIIPKQEFIEYNDRLAEGIALFNTTDDEMLESEDCWGFTCSEIKYFWQETVWDSHVPNADFDQIQAFYQQNIN